MLRSMTGHGEARGESADFLMAIEVRTVNNRFLRLVTKVPDNVAFLQPSLEDEVRKRVARGSVFLTVRFQPTTSADFYEIDEQVLRKYHAQLSRLSEELDTGEDVVLKDLLALPGATRSDEDSVPDKNVVLKAARDCLVEALAGLNDMREREGRNLLAEFQERSKLLTESLAKVRILAPEGIKEYQKRLEERLNQALTQHEITLSPDDLVKEVAILAERSDISEEIERLQSHHDQFDHSLKTGGTVGRKLEFIIQEMFREANTMASKSVHPEINRLLVEYKTELDRFKEQVQNVE